MAQLCAKLWLGFDSWPGNFHTLGAAVKKKRGGGLFIFMDKVRVPFLKLPNLRVATLGPFLNVALFTLYFLPLLWGLCRGWSSKPEPEGATGPWSSTPTWLSPPSPQVRTGFFPCFILWHLINLPCCLGSHGARSPLLAPGMMALHPNFTVPG